MADLTNRKFNIKRLHSKTEKVVEEQVKIKTTSAKNLNEKDPSAMSGMGIHAFRRHKGYADGNAYYCIQLAPADSPDDGFHRALTNSEVKKFCWDVKNSRYNQDFSKNGVDTRDFHVYKYWRDYINATR